MFSWFKKKAAAPSTSTSESVDAALREQASVAPALAAAVEPAPSSPSSLGQPVPAAEAEAAAGESLEASAAEAPDEAPPTFDELKALLDASPQDAELALKAARAGIAEGKTVQALPIFHRAARMTLERDPDAGIAAYAELRKLADLGSEVHFALSETHQAAGRMREAEQELRAILRGDMNNPEALMRLCDICLATDRHRDAELICTRLMGIDPRDPFVREKVGDVYAATGKPDEALKSYLLAAHSFASMQEKTEALRLYERVVELDPYNSTAAREMPALRAALG